MLGPCCVHVTAWRAWWGKFLIGSTKKITGKYSMNSAQHWVHYFSTLWTRFWENLGNPWFDAVIVSWSKMRRVQGFVLFIPLSVLRRCSSPTDSHCHQVTPRHGMDDDLVQRRETGFICIAQALLIYTRTLIRQRVLANSSRYTLSVFVGRNFSYLCAKFENKNYTSVYISLATHTHTL